jgi:SAM-dependent methyltransferase
MNHAERASWEARHRGTVPGAPEPSLLEFLPLLPRGLALDIAAGTGRHAIALARAGFHVVAVDYSSEATSLLAAIARKESLSIMPVIADLQSTLPFSPESFDFVIDINFLERALVPSLKAALRRGGIMLFETFLEDQANLGHPRDPRFLLKRYELREMLSDMELIRYREGLTIYAAERRAWRATALARCAI